MKISEPYLKQPSILPTPPSLWEKRGPPFFEKF